MGKYKTARKKVHAFEGTDSLSGWNGDLPLRLGGGRDLLEGLHGLLHGVDLVGLGLAALGTERGDLVLRGGHADRHDEAGDGADGATGDERADVQGRGGGAGLHDLELGAAGGQVGRDGGGGGGGVFHRIPSFVGNGGWVPLNPM